MLFSSTQVLFSEEKVSSEDSLLILLEDAISKRAFYDTQKQKRIEFLIKKRNSTQNIEAKYAINDKIFDEYRYYSFDKALRYVEKDIKLAEQLKDNLYLNRIKLKLSMLLLSTSRYKESVDALNEIKKLSLPNSLIKNYYLAYNEAYSGLSYHNTLKQTQTKYKALYLAYQDSLLLHSKTDSEEVLRIKEKEFRDSRVLEKAFEINDIRLSKVSENTRLFSLITFERSLLYDIQNNTTAQKKYLILSAISDIKASVKDNASLSALAKILFTEGKINLAHRYINLAYADAEFYNSKLRFVNIANSLSLITKAYEQKNATQKQKLQKFLIFISVLAFFLFVAAYLIYRQVKKISKAKNELAIANNNLSKLYQELTEVDKIKEHYIGTFVNLYSEYISKLDVYRKLINKYVNANQIGNLIKLSESKKIIDDEIEIFNTNFDTSFLHIHPNFIDDVNALLKPNNQIIVKDKSRLNKELRILALIKLGITSSSKISKILRYSVNTIYNYRSSLKKMALNKTTFEDFIKNIN